MKLQKGKSAGKSEQAAPTRSELEILRVLWENGPSTVRAVNDRLNEEREVNYTSTLKLMQIMVDKGILIRDESQMKHVYQPAEAEQQTKTVLLERFVKTVYNNSPSSLMLQLLGNQKVSKKELEAMKEVLRNLERH